MRKLVIISHTDHQLDESGRIVGWGPTVNEINHLARHFDRVEHVACLDKAKPRGGSLPYTGSMTLLRPIPVFGGSGLLDKATVLTTAPRVLRTVRQAIADATHVQLRLPMGIGLYLLPLLASMRDRRFVLWVKYANDWGQASPPFGYALQRWMLKRNLADCKVTINGFWEGQPNHCISFENPCLEETEIEVGRQAAASKRYDKPFDLCFVGRLEEAKGASRILDALRRCTPEHVGNVHFLGDGSDIERYRRDASFLGEKAHFHGFCSTSVVKDVLRSSHFYLLPTTASEGFPKAVAEAACYGCIPLVSDVGSIPHYIEDGANGFVWHRTGGLHFGQTLEKAFSTPPETLGKIARNGSEMASLFTFERYIQRLETEILNP